MSYSSETLRQARLSMDPKARCQAQFGPRVAKRLHGIFLSQTRADAPLNRVYIDITQLDCYVLIQVSKEERYEVRSWLSSRTQANARSYANKVARTGKTLMSSQHRRPPASRAFPQTINNSR